MFEVKIKDSNGKALDIAVDMRFAQEMIEVSIDEAPSVIKELAKGEYIYVEILSPKTMLGQSKICEFEIEVNDFKGNQSCRVNAVVGK